MNNYERSRVVELGRGSDLIRSAKIWAPFWIDSEAIINYFDLWIDDIDESDD